MFSLAEDLTQLTSSSCVRKATVVKLSGTAATTVLLCQLLYSYSSSLKVSNFLLLAKNEKSTNEITYFVKYFSLFAKFPLTNYNLITYLALYKEDQATH